ncbi:hypothetical protein [Actinokineospora enzanensis]|uniref:hypothetical protein n=1 Tax=Actinokineospora enzanensis TaxID=155975 RepID=UPI00036B4600|nr:hypothetical protein [Actinokineospora enzanensis]
MRRSRVTALAASVLAASALVVAAQPGSAIATGGVDNGSDRLYVEAEAYTFDEPGVFDSGDANTVAVAAASDTACTDTTYALKTWKVSGTLTWYYNGTGVPANIANTALQAITDSSNTVAKGTNRCGLPATFTTIYKYAGTSTVKPQVASNASCTGNDGKSVIGWGTLPTKVLAYTCTYYNARGVVVSSDTLIDNKQYTWFTSLPANCAGQQYDLQSTITHERLHTAGLAHVDQVKNAAQTMVPASTPCTVSRRLLGAGDYAGLKALAGATK